MKRTKNSIWASGLSLVLCCAILVGTTFAWFTDSVSNKGNKIEAGTLDVALEELGANGQYAPVGEEAIFNSKLWEPGYSDAAVLQVKNNGTLALKYSLKLLANGDAGKLGDVIDVYAITGNTAITEAPTSLEDALNSGYANVGTLNSLIADVDGAAHGSLAAGASAYAGIVLQMRETTGNDYQNLSVGTNFDILLSATQQTAEVDGFGSDRYDKDATHPVVVLPSTAQGILDATMEPDATVLLPSGTYSKLQLNQSANSELVESSGLDKLYRNIQNLTIEGGEKTVVDGIDITFGHIYGTADKPVTNPVTGETTTSTVNSFYSYISIDNLTIRNVTFSKGVAMNMWGGSTYGTVKNVTFENCTFDGSLNDYANSNTSIDNKLVNFSTGDAVFENIVFSGCTVKDAYQGIYTQNVKNILIENCTFTNITHNAIAIQSSDEKHPVGGSVIIRNNTIINDSNRAIRFGDIASDAVIEITGNKMIDSGYFFGGQLLKAENVAEGALITIKGNYWDGTALSSAIGKEMGTDTAPLSEY